jgi:hypothetical protein
MAQRNCEQQHYTSSQTLEFRSPAHAGPRERKTAACPAKEFWPRTLRFKHADSLASELATEAATKMNPATGAAKGSTAGNCSSVGLDSRTKSGQGLHIAAETKNPAKKGNIQRLKLISQSHDLRCRPPAGGCKEAPQGLTRSERKRENEQRMQVENEPAEITLEATTLITTTQNLAGESEKSGAAA